MNAERRQVAVYSYADEQGQLLFEVVRFEPKSFAQRRPDGNGGWTWALNGAHRVLYRLPELLAAPLDAIVFIPEGEKDVESLRGLGLVATCSPAGAGKWKAEFGPFLQSRNVVILPDNDGPGLAHADEVARSLFLTAASVKVLWLPGLDEHGDVTDWLALGYTREDLLRAVAETPEWTRPTETAEAEQSEPSAVSEAKRIEELAKLDAIAYEQVREKEAERLGIRVAILDREVSKRRPVDDEGQGQALALADPEPWPEPVDGAELLSELAATFTGFLTLPPGAATLLSLWTVFSHAHDAFQVSPLLAVTSPEPGCGKSSLLALLSALTRRALATANVTSAALFRTVEKFEPCLLVDEADSFLRDNEELRGVLNSGWLRSSAAVVRVVGDEHEPRLFSTWAPKAIALIGKLPGTLADRSIEIRMRRQLAEEERSLRKLRADRLHELEPLRQQAWRWAQDKLESLRAGDPNVPDQLANRQADNWRPLLAIADQAGGDWPTMAREAVKDLAASSSEESAGVMLLADLRQLFAEREVDRLASSEIVAALVEREDRPWPEWRHGKPITARGVAKLLARFGVVPATIRFGVSLAKGYHLEELADCFARFLPASPSVSVTPSQAATGAGSVHSQSVTPDGAVTDANVRNPAKNGPCYAVTDENPVKGQRGQETAACGLPQCAGCYEVEPGRWFHPPRSGTGRAGVTGPS